MNPETWKRIRPFLEEAMDLDSEARRTFLEELSREQSESDLRMIQEILEKNEAAGDFLDPPSLLPSMIPSTVNPGQKIGAYRALRAIGHGGMADVYLAARADDEFEQRVAIKVARPDWGSKDTAARFEEERRILAALEHDSIARIFDGGTLENGKPYFVMEYIDGIPIDRYCDEHRYSIEERLRLFQKVCEAVQAAHRRLIVHRDLKPANILVRADGTPKLLDFGIAKLLSEDLAGQTTLTRTGLRPMTPEYASPEQISGDFTTTATDIYALGVLLYRLLTGQWPYAIERWSLIEISRAICDDEAILPSMRVLQAEVEGSNEVSFAERCRLESPARLARRLRGDLDQILVRALRKDPESRYGSAEELREDIERELASLPVKARKGGRLYRARKFIRRRSQSLAVAFLAVVLALTAGLQTWLFINLCGSGSV